MTRSCHFHRHCVTHLCGEVKSAFLGKHQGGVINKYQKLLSKMGKFIKAFTRPGDYIVDVMAGTCTTAVRNVIDLLTPV